MKKNIFLSILSAALLIVSFPNFNLSFLIWIGLVPFLLLLDGKTPKAAFFWGWLTGFLFFVGTHYWLIHVTLPGMVLVSVYLGIYFGLFGLGYAFFQKLPLKHKLWTLPSLWVALEFLRDRLFTGFGWACLGHSQYKMLHLIQIADITGVFGVSFLVVMVNVLIKSMIEGKKGPRVPFYFVIVLFGGVLLYGIFGMIPFVGKFDGTMVAIIQPNIPQSLKWNPNSWPVSQKKILDLTAQAVKEKPEWVGWKPDLIIWPETSFPGYTWHSPDRYEEVKRFVARNKVPLLLGTVTMRGETEFYNSAILLSAKGEEVARYNKMHLVPFGEFLPLRPILGWIGNFAPIGDDFSRGETLTVFPQGFSTLICFEDTVAPIVRKLVKNGPTFLVNITNDGWFKDTNEPYLHLAGSVFQSIGHRRSIVRAANTGVSGIISPDGRIDAFRNGEGKSVMVEGVFYGGVRGNRELSFYTKFGDVFVYLCFFAVGAAVIKRKILL